MSERFPLDFDKLQRGDILSPEQVEAAVLKSRTDPDYRLRCLGLRNMIEAHFADVRGDIATVVVRNDGLQILTHAEQAEYAPMKQAQAIRAYRKRHLELGAVDAAQLPSDEARQRLARAQELSGWRVQQLLKPPPKELPL